MENDILLLNVASIDNFYTKNRYDFCHNLFLNNISRCLYASVNS